MLRIGDGVTNHDIGDAGNSHNVTGDSLFGRLTLEAYGAQQLGYLHGLGVLVAVLVIVDPGHLLALLDTAGVDAKQSNTAEEVGGVQVGNVRLQRGINGSGRLRQDVIDDVEKRLQVLALRNVAIARVLGGGNASTAGCVENRQVQQLLGGGCGFFIFQAGGDFQQQVLGLGDNLVNAGIRAVSLVHADNNRQLSFQCLSEHEARLWQRTLGGIDQQNYAVNHGNTALNLATEVGVARGVNNVDDKVLAVLAQALAVNSRVLGQNGNAALTLLIVGVHDAVRVFTVVTKGAGLLQHAVDQGGLAMVNVRDNGNITELGITH